MSQQGYLYDGTILPDIETLTGDIGGAIGPDAAFNVNIFGGTNITTTGAGNTITIDLVATIPVTLGGTGVTSITDHALIVGSGAGAISEVGPLNNGELAIGSTGADPVAASLTQPAAGFTITGAAGSITFALADDLSAVEGLGGTGIAVRSGASTWTTRSLTAPAAGLTITNNDGVAGNPTFALANDLAALEGLGGTGFAVRTAADTWNNRSLTAPAAGFTITNNDGVAGNPTFALADDLAGVEGIATTGIVSRTAADTWTATSITQHAVLIGDAGEVPTEVGPLTDGELVIGSTGNAPQASTLTAGSGINITNAAGSITIATTGGGMPWTVEVGAAVATAVDNGYISNRAGGVTYTLPAASAVGSVIRICSIQGLSTIAQNAGQSIQFGAFTTTVGVGGSLVATNVGDTVEIVCTIANAQWSVLSSIGNWTVN